MIVRESIVIAASLAGTWLLAAGPPALLTVAQRDGVRSVRAPRTADVSADGRFVAFESFARLVPADTDDGLDIYVLDRTTRRVTLESAVPDDDEVEYSHPRTSGDGRYVVFESRASPSMNTRRTDIVLHDRVSGTTRVLTPATAAREPHGWSRDPDISDDARVVSFSSAATTLIDGPDANGALEDVYIVHLPAGIITRASVNSSGVQPDRGDSALASLSADGRWLVFASTAPLVDGPPPGSNLERQIRQIYLRDIVNGKTTRVTRAASGGLPNGASWLPSISADGRRVAFSSDASNLLDGDRNRAADVFLYDRDANALSWVSRGADGSSAGGESTGPVVSGNGRFVAFQSDAANLVCARHCSGHADDINLLWDTFLFDSATGTIARTSEDELGGWMEPSAGPALDATGQVVAFSSRHPVDAADRGNDFDLFVRAISPPSDITRRFP